MHSTPSYFLGLPMWRHSHWQGRLLPHTGQPLRDYASVFNTVEGNTTFYALPSMETAQQWLSQTSENFRFCFKFPQVISHHQQLRHCDKELSEFLNLMTLLKPRLGRIMLQLPAQFDASALPLLEQFVGKLPENFSYGVEVRHMDFFAKGDAERSLNRLLLEHQIERITFDTRAVHTDPASDSATLEAKEQKPKVPARAVALTQQPMVRLIGRMLLEQNGDYLAQWTSKLVQWIEEGRQPFLFIHTPDNSDAPLLAQLFHQQLALQLPQQIDNKLALKQQESLF